MTAAKKKWIERLLILSIAVTVTTNSPVEPRINKSIISLVDNAIDFLMPDYTLTKLHQKTPPNANT